MNHPASFRAVKFLPLLAFVFLTGCQTYTKLTVSDYHGDRVADWIAEGSVKKVEQGYAIKAVERHSGPPNEVVNHYPNGWRTTVVGANIIRQRVDKPEWLAEFDGEKK